MEEDLLKMIRIRPIEAADDPHMARLVRESLRRHGLDIPGTAYFDPELDHLSAHYALRPDRQIGRPSVDDPLRGGVRVAVSDPIPFFLPSAAWADT